MPAENSGEALVYAIIGGLFFGTYPFFIRTKAVLRAQPRPIVFQLYKSTMVFLAGFLFLIPRAFQERATGEPLFVFSWWAYVHCAPSPGF